MIDTEKKYLFKLVVISFFYIIIKYLVSYFYNPDQSLFLKIISFGEKDFISYSFLAESLSRLDLSTDWNEFEKAKNDEKFFPGCLFKAGRLLDFSIFPPRMLLK